MGELYDQARDVIDQMSIRINDLELKVGDLKDDLDNADEIILKLRNDLSFALEQKAKLENELRLMKNIEVN